MFKFLKTFRHFYLNKIIAVVMLQSFLIGAVVCPQVIHAQSVYNLPEPGTRLTLSPAYKPAIVTGMTIYPQEPLRFDFIIDIGDDKLQGQALKKESQKLINYFMATLTVPEDEMWVNLSPYEKDRIIAEGLSHTEMGRDMLAQDYLLKQFAASLMYPEEEFGQEFWSRVYKKVKAKYGTIDIPMNTFNKIWIVPQNAVIYIHGRNVFVAENHLKVMLEEDYLSLESNVGSTKHGLGEIGKEDIDLVTGVSAEIVRDILLPEVEREVNEGKTFANLRQMYNSMLLATWYKKNVKESFIGKVYAGQNKTEGIELEDKTAKQKIYDQYVKAFEKGVYNYIKEDLDLVTQRKIPRKYFSGGVEDYIGQDGQERFSQVNGSAPQTLVDIVKRPHVITSMGGQTIERESRSLNRLDVSKTLIPLIQDNSMMSVELNSELPKIDIVDSSGAAVVEFVSILGLENASVGSQKRVIGDLEIYSVRLPGINLDTEEPVGADLFRELLTPEQWDQFSKEVVLDMVYKSRADGTRELIAIFPDLEDIESDQFTYFFDLSEYYVPYQLLQNVNDPDAFEQLKLYALRAAESRESIAQYKNDKYKKRLLYRKWSHEKQTAYVYVSLAQDSVQPRIMPFDLDVFTDTEKKAALNKLELAIQDTDSSAASTVFTVLPTVYSFASNQSYDFSFITDGIMQARKFPFKDQDRVMDLGTGTGYFLWAIIQSIQRSENGTDKNLSYFAIDKNPMAVASAEINLNKIAGLSVNIKASDNFVSSNGVATFSDDEGQALPMHFIATNAPAYPGSLDFDSIELLKDGGIDRLMQFVELKEKERRQTKVNRISLGYLHDGGYGALHFWVRLLGGVELVLDQDRGKVLAWNAEPLYSEDPVKVIAEDQGLDIKIINDNWTGTANYVTYLVSRKEPTDAANPDESMLSKEQTEEHLGIIIDQEFWGSIYLLGLKESVDYGYPEFSFWDVFIDSLPQWVQRGVFSPSEKYDTEEQMMAIFEKFDSITQEFPDIRENLLRQISAFSLMYESGDVNFHGMRPMELLNEVLGSVKDRKNTDKIIVLLNNVLHRDLLRSGETISDLARKLNSDPSLWSDISSRGRFIQGIVKRKPYILVVDDQMYAINDLVDELRQTGYEVEIADNGLSGLDAVQRKRPDLIITDVTMPQMNGVELTRQLNEQYPNIPVVVRSSDFGNESFYSRMLSGFLWATFDNVVGVPGKSNYNISRTSNLLRMYLPKIDSKESTDDQAILATPGGIDFNANNIKLEERGDKTQINFINSSSYIFNSNTINGISPVIINITPLPNGLLLLGQYRQDDQNDDIFSMN